METERIENLAAVIAGCMLGSYGYSSGRIIDPQEIAADAVAIAAAIIGEAKKQEVMASS